ncbi:DUF5916 domain-containing protein [Rubricoccus marinus]|uniref:DUF5916 domain-containing protein n=1 Tax=Rubricoccus marinus TaxID=716817 RepID=A0A259TWI9_9BACT|nr:DUF5916 domain-containing protein [Rubricoccus marinus]OZC01908.1 hypothetical protein BSZ36_02240 [Rubricoccus marinus]
MPIPFRAALALLFFAPLAHAQPSASVAPAARGTAPSLRALALQPGQEPRIDGVLDEAAWAEAPRAGSFVQRIPNPGQPAGEKTEVSVLYGTDAVYVGFTCWVRDPSTLVARMARRDQFVGSDRVAVAFDSYNDDRTAFYFGVTAAGVNQDILMFNDGNEDSSWDAVWEGKTARFDDARGQGWTVEMRIPFSQLRYSTGAGPEVWGLQFQRRVPASGEDVFWAPILPEGNGFVSRFGQLDGLDVERAPRQLEVIPYALTQLTRAPGDADDPFYAANDLGPNAGFDAKVGLTSDLTLTATVNPDFGQVEADPAVVNLSQFEVFFQERRPFFVEGVDIFDYGSTRTNNTSNRPTFFYSRRIGRSPVRRVGGPGIAYVDSPQQTTIASAAKVSGKIGGWSVGLLDAVTLEERARYVTASGENLTTPVEPLSNYLVGRVRRNVGGSNTSIGGIVTATNRQMGSEALFDGVAASGAYMAGVDFEHWFSGRQWVASGVAAATTVNGTEAFITRLQNAPQRYYQRPDADHLGVDPTRTNLSGAYSELSLQRSVEGSWDASLTANVLTPGLELNDLGFQGRADAASLNYFIGKRWPEAKAFRRVNLYHYGGSGVNFAGDRVITYFGGGAGGELNNRWNFDAGFNFAPVSKNDRLTRGGPLAERPMDASINASLGTDDSKTVSAGVGVSFRSEFGNDYAGAPPEYDRGIGLGVTVRPSNAIALSFEPEYSREFDNDQYVTRVAAPEATSTFGNRYVFADIDQESFSLGIRADWTFTTDLSLQLYAQPFVTAGRYSNLKEFATPGSFDYDVYGDARGSATPQVPQRDASGAIVRDGDGNTLYREAGADETAARYLVDPGDGGEAFAVGNQDFSFRSLRGNAVLRWEYRPGSSLFFVWQQQRTVSDDFNGFSVPRELGEVFRSPVENVFLIKATYWFGL